MFLTKKIFLSLPHATLQTRNKNLVFLCFRRDIFHETVKTFRFRRRQNRFYHCYFSIFTTRVRTDEQIRLEIFDIFNLKRIDRM